MCEKKSRTMKAKKEILRCLLMNSPLINLICFTAHMHFKLNKVYDPRFGGQLEPSN